MPPSVGTHHQDRRARYSDRNPTTFTTPLDKPDDLLKRLQKLGYLPERIDSGVVRQAIPSASFYGGLIDVAKGFLLKLCRSEELSAQLQAPEEPPMTPNSNWL